MWETRVWSLGWEDPLEKVMSTHSSILAWKIPWMEKPGRLQSVGSQRVGHDWVPSLSFKHALLPHLYIKIDTICMTPNLLMFYTMSENYFVNYCINVHASQVALVVKDPTSKWRRHKRLGFNPWVRKISWRRKWQSAPVFLPGESHGQSSLAGLLCYMGSQRVWHDWSDLTTCVSKE